MLDILSEASFFFSKNDYNCEGELLSPGTRQLKPTIATSSVSWFRSAGELESVCENGVSGVAVSRRASFSCGPEMKVAELTREDDEALSLSEDIIYCS